MKRLVKIVIIILMSLGFALMFNHTLLGQNFHEIGGLVVLALFLVHFFIYGRWVVSITKNIFKKGMNTKTRIGYIINLLLLICVVLILISGILSSKVVFAGISTQSTQMKGLHQSLSCVALALAGLHLGLHWSSIFSAFKKALKSKTAQRVVVTILALALIAAGVYGFINTGFVKNIQTISMVFSTEQMPGGSEGGGPGGPEGGGPGGSEGNGPGGPQSAASFSAITGALVGNLAILGLFAVVSALLALAFKKPGALKSALPEDAVE